MLIQCQNGLTLLPEVAHEIQQAIGYMNVMKYIGYGKSTVLSQYSRLLDKHKTKLLP